MGDQFLCSDEVALSEVLQQIEAEKILIIGPRVRWQLQGYLNAHQDARVAYIGFAELEEKLASESRYDCILVAEILENLNKLQAQKILDALRQFSGQVFVRVQLGKAWLKQTSLWEPQEMRAKGYDLQGLAAEGGRPVGLFHYDVHTYKKNAEWLNSKYWAHPD